MLCENENITPTEMERNIGASKGVLSRAIKNSTDIQNKWVEKIIINYPKYSVRWLLTGEGEMIDALERHKEDNALQRSKGNNGVSEPHGEYKKGSKWSPLIACAVCAEKDERIADLKDQIATLTRIIDGEEKQQTKQGNGE